MGRYAKGVDGVDHFYQPDDLYKYAGEPFDVRVSILDERPDDALWVAVPEDNISRSIGEILDDGQFDVVWETDDVVVGDAWSDFIPESAVLTADWTYPWVCGNCTEPRFATAE